MLSTLDAVRFDMTNLDRKLLPHSIYDVLTQILNDSQRSLYRVQCRKTLAAAAHRVRCRHGVTNLSRRNKATSASNRRPPLLEFSPALESWSDIYTGPTSCLIVPQTFSSFVFFICHLYLSVTRLGCSLNALSSISWVDLLLIGYKFVLVLGPDSFSKAFLKNYIPHL